MDEIKFDKRNYRLHNDENKRVIKKSLKELGAGRSIVIDKDGEIIAGTGVYEQAKKLGIKTKIVETDGSELVVVKRTDLATGDDKRKKLALADNAASDTSEWAEELLREDWTPEVLADFGIVLPDVEMPDDMQEQEKDEHVEELLNAAMVQYISEYVRNISRALIGGKSAAAADDAAILYWSPIIRFKFPSYVVARNPAIPVFPPSIILCIAS